MDSFKEFQGKSLDEAISEACAYFDAPREKLEIEILQDSKSGIFGLVGARKAKVRARRVQLRTAVEDILGRKSGLTLNTAEETEADAGTEKPRQEGKGQERHADRHDKHDRAERQERQDKRGSRHDKGSEHGEKNDRACKDREQPEGSVPDADTATVPAQADGETAESQERPERPERGERAEKSERADRPDRSDRQDRGDGRRSRSASKNGARRGERSERPSDRQGDRHNDRSGDPRQRGKAAPRPRTDDMPFHGDAFSEEVLHEDGDELQRIPFEELDQDRLRALSLEVVGKLVSPIVGDLPLSVELQDGRVNVRMDCGDDSGLLIGREGQTLASLQYLASRMVSRGMSAAVRVQLDAGEYRLRQDEKLREMALSLADKVRATGKSHSTRPLSSYHRRIVHLVLQDSADVQTRSSGDGPLKRVVIQRKRS